MATTACAPSGAHRARPVQAASPTAQADPALTLGGPDAEHAPATVVPSPATRQASLCGAESFWADDKCLPRREVLSLENVAHVVSRCDAGDDQSCPLALQQHRHNCDLGVEEQCAAARRLLDGWITRREHRWADARCELGQYAACLLAAEHERRRCLDAHTESCHTLTERLQQMPDLQRDLELSNEQRRAVSGAKP